jgi:hypothetical protein
MSAAAHHASHSPCAHLVTEALRTCTLNITEPTLYLDRAHRELLGQIIAAEELVAGLYELAMALNGLVGEEHVETKDNDPAPADYPYIVLTRHLVENAIRFEAWYETASRLAQLICRDPEAVEVHPEDAEQGWGAGVRER